MSDRHPILGQEYRVQDVESDLLGTMCRSSENSKHLEDRRSSSMSDADSAVPVGEDEYGNFGSSQGDSPDNRDPEDRRLLIVEQFTDDSAEANRVVWTAKNFREAVTNGGLVIQ